MLRVRLRSQSGAVATIGLVAGLAAIATLATIVAPVALATRNYAFSASYTGHGRGGVSGTRAFVSATATGRGSIIGRGTLTGSARGVFTSQRCVLFGGRAVLKGRHGSIKLAARRAQACAGNTDANDVSFSGSAQVTGGTSTFAGARGTLSFAGTYRRQSGAVRISFRGRISF
jgi:hypothetical protein